MPPVASEPKIAAPTRPLPTPAMKPGNLEDRGETPFAELLDSAPVPAPERSPERLTDRSSDRPQARSSRRDAASSAGQKHNADSKSPAKAKSKDGAKESKPADDAADAADDASNEKQDETKVIKVAAAIGDVTAAIDPLIVDATKPDAKTDGDETTVATDPAQAVKNADAAVIAVPVVSVPVPAAVIAAPQVQAEIAPAAIDAAGAAPQLELPKDLKPQRADAAGKTADAPKSAIAVPAKAEAPAAPALDGAKPAPAANAKGQDAETPVQDAPVDAAAKADRHAVRTETAADPAAPQANANNAAKPADAAQTLNVTPQVNHAAATAPASHAPAAPAVTVPVEGLAVEIAAKAQAGKNRFEIRLDPPELGRIDVRLDVDKHGQVTSRLIVERAETLDLLRRDAPQLERALQDAGLKTSDNGLQFSLRQQTGDQNAPGTNPDSAHLFVTDDELPPIEATQRGYGRLAGMGGGLDIRV